MQGASRVPFQNRLVKSMSFPIRDYNRQVLSQVVDQNSELLIHFSIVPSDFYFNEPSFSPIIEVRNNVSTFSAPAISVAQGEAPGETMKVDLTFSGNINITADALRVNLPGDSIIPTGDYRVRLQVRGVDLAINFHAETEPNNNVSISSVVLDSQTQSTFVEFVHACPPFCSGGDGD
jgi:hypothetical protein